MGVENCSMIVDTCSSLTSTDRRYDESGLAHDLHADEQGGTVCAMGCGESGWKLKFNQMMSTDIGN